MRPARRDQRPASTAARMLFAMVTGSRAFETAVLSSTAEQPSSIASAASEAVPIPASSTTGTGERAHTSSMRCGLQMPSPEPIGAPSGITNVGKLAADDRILGAIGQHHKAIRDQRLCRADELLRVGIEQLAVADHLDLDPVRFQRLARKLGGEDRVLRGLATCRVGQEMDLLGNEIDEALVVTGKADPSDRSGRHFAAAGSERIKH